MVLVGSAPELEVKGRRGIDGPLLLLSLLLKHCRRRRHDMREVEGGKLCRFDKEPRFGSVKLDVWVVS